MNILYLSGCSQFHYLMDRSQSEQWLSGNSPVLFPLLSLSIYLSPPSLQPEPHSESSPAEAEAIKAD